jgi:hypothetical protein
MKATHLYLAGMALALLPLCAAAQTDSANDHASDVKYCNALAAKYQQTHAAQQAPAVGVDAAIDSCNSAKVESAIATLEKALRDARVDLPPHNGQAQSN